MFSVILLLLFADGSGVWSETLRQLPTVSVLPGERLQISCQVSYSVSVYTTAWIRHPAGKGLEWISSDTTIKESLKNKFRVNIDESKDMLTLKGDNMQPEDSAVYYCALDPQ